MSRLETRLAKLEAQSDPGEFWTRVIIPVGATEEDIDRLTAEAIEKVRPQAGNREISVIQRVLV